MPGTNISADLTNASPLCTALKLSDGIRCEAPAVSGNGKFCAFHDKQCRGLYNGYKRRNATLSKLDENPPTYIRRLTIALANETFTKIKEEGTLGEVHGYLLQKFRLLDRVIRARKLHHTHFFAQDNDYGHQHYLDTLQSQRTVIVGALERVERCALELLYKKRKWLAWIRQCQDEEDAQRDKEQKIVKREAALFQRHEKKLKDRLKANKEKEAQLLQDQYLDQVYQQRLSEGLDEDWDPIEDVVEDHRNSYMDLIWHFLWREPPGKPEPTSPIAEEQAISGPSTSAESQTAPSSKKGKKSKSKKAPTGTNVETEPEEPGKVKMETRAEMEARLKHGSQLKWEEYEGLRIIGSVDNPVATMDKTVVLTSEEIEILLSQVSEVKELLFCRLVLSHAAALEVALRVNTIEEFLNSADVPDADLRALCLSMERPRLEDIRDACADLMRVDDESSLDDDDEFDPESEEQQRQADNRFFKKTTKPSKKSKETPETWISKYEEQLQEAERSLNNPIAEQTSGPVDFGEAGTQDDRSSRRTKIKVLGRAIYNYPSERAMTRGGWLQFCVLAKDSSLYDAIHLCRTWDEFWELNVLAMFQYFPAAKWLNWVGNRMNSQLLTLGFIPYYHFDASEHLHHHRSGGRRPHQQVYRQHRNLICGHMKRSDPVSRRFIQYVAMQANEVMMVVRDAKTGRIVVPPDPEENWIIREKTGPAWASSGGFKISMALDTNLLNKIDSERRWRFGFSDYYDIYIWNLDHTDPYTALYNKVQEMLFKASRVREHKDLYSVAAPVLKTITRDKTTARAKDIRPGENVESIYDNIRSESFRLLSVEMELKGKKLVKLRKDGDGLRDAFYNDVDMLEDRVLFPEDDTGEIPRFNKLQVSNAMDKLSGPPDKSTWERWINGLDSDDEYEPIPKKENQPLRSLVHKDIPHTCNEDDKDEDWEDMDDESKASGMFEVDFESLMVKHILENMTDLECHAFSIAMENVEAMEEENIIPDREDKSADSEELKIVYEENQQRMHNSFMTLLDREKSKAFKECWHNADLTPDGQKKYAEMRSIIDAAIKDTLRRGKWVKIFTQVVNWICDDMPANERVRKDVLESVATMALFFEPVSIKNREGVDITKSTLFDAKTRAQSEPPERRSSTSCMFRPKEFWAEWDQLEVNKKKGNVLEMGNMKNWYPVAWDVHIRPIVARLFKEGIIYPYSSDSASGVAISASDPNHGRREMFIDYRSGLQGFPPELEDPMKPSLTTSSLLKAAKDYSTKYPQARFAILRLWSAEHFWPLLVGPESRKKLAFIDSYRRFWSWHFVPKDMEGSEGSIHHNCRMRLQPYYEKFKTKVVVRQDMFLVMDKSEKELQKTATAVTYAIQSRPWRLEIDLWRSFVNVDYQFLEEMNKKWLD